MALFGIVISGTTKLTFSTAFQEKKIKVAVGLPDIGVPLYRCERVNSKSVWMDHG